MGQGGEFKLKKAHGSEAGTMVVEHVEAYAQPDGRIAKAFISNWAKLRSSLAPRVAFARCVCARARERAQMRGASRACRQGRESQRGSKRAGMCRGGRRSKMKRRCGIEQRARKRAAADGAGAGEGGEGRRLAV